MIIEAILLNLLEALDPEQNKEYDHYLVDYDLSDVCCNNINHLIFYLLADRMK